MNKQQASRVITRAQAQQIERSLKLDAFAEATWRKVMLVARGESLPRDPGLESAIRQELDRWYT